MRIDRRRVRAARKVAQALLALSLCAGLVAVATPCAAFCAQASQPPTVADADASSHCARTAPVQRDAPSPAPGDCCSDDCDACGFDRASVPAQAVALQLVVPDQAPMLVSIDGRAAFGAHHARIRARSPDDARAHLLDVLLRTTTLLI